MNDHSNRKFGDERAHPKPDARSAGAEFADSSEFIEQQQRVIESQLRLLDLSPDMMVIANLEGYFTYVNPACEKILGFTPAELTAQPYLTFVHPDDVASTVAVAQELSQGVELVGFENRYRTKAGDYRWLSWNVTTFPEHNQFYANTRDVTEKKQAEAEKEQLLQREQEARQEAERANQIKDDFLAVVSHELRSPLNPILGWSQLLQRKALSPEKTEVALATIESNAKLQVQLIDDLLDIARILRRKMSLEAVPVDLNQVIPAAVETVRLAAEAKSIQLQTAVSDELSVVIGDARRLQQVIWNLLSNAVKFTPNGGQVTVSAETVDGTHARIQVTDTGRGISSDFLPHIFEHFQQENNATTRQFGGLGLGLAIVQQLVEMHDGTISVQSPGVGQGATFTVKLPLVATPFSELPQDVLPVIESVDLSGLHILIVDDEPDSRAITEYILEDTKAVVTVATSGADALDKFQQLAPDVLVTDIDPWPRYV